MDDEIIERCYYAANKIEAHTSIDVVKTIIKAMREPTEKMLIVAGHQQFIIDYYQAMIDSILND